MKTIKTTKVPNGSVDPSTKKELLNKAKEKLGLLLNRLNKLKTNHKATFIKVFSVLGVVGHVAAFAYHIIVIFEHFPPT